MNVTVFGGSTCSDEVGAMAEELGRLLAQAGHVVVTGGYGGVMSWVSKGACEAGGEAVGVVLNGVQEPNMFVNTPVFADDYWERLGKLMKLGDAYIVLPRGSGTSVELLAALHTQANREKLMPGTSEKRVIALCPSFEDRARMDGCVVGAAGGGEAGGYEFLTHLVRVKTPQEAVTHLKAI